MSGRFPKANGLCVAVFALALVIVSPSRADWINLTGAETSPNIAEIYVHEDHVKLVLEVYIGDLETFGDLIPDDWVRDKTIKRPPLEERVQRFASDTFQFITDDGKKLEAEVKLVEPRQRIDRRSPYAGMINPMTRRRVPEAPADKRVLYAEIVYPFKDKPRELKIVPPLDGEGRPKVTIGFILYHQSVPVIDFRYLGAPVRLTLDWNDPWYSKFENPNLKRHHKSALMTFLYVEPYEVRHELLVRVKDMEEWMDLGLRGKEYIEIDELEPLKNRIGEFLLKRNKMLIDGKSLKPILDRTNFVKVSLTGIQILEKPERLDLAGAIVGVIIAYITDGMPKEVTVDWDLFTDQVKKVPATAVDPAGPLATYLTPDDRVHKWSNFLKTYRVPTVEKVRFDEKFTRANLPVGSLLALVALIPALGVFWVRRQKGSPTRVVMSLAFFLLVASVALYPFKVSVAKPVALASRMTGEEARAVLHTLLKNVYRAFDFREETDVYDKLALSVSGDLLDDVYLQNRKSLEIKRAGGAQAKVKEVEIEDAKIQSGPGNALTNKIKARWTAAGTVGHWGHVHTRKNLYDALVTIEPVDGSWKITGLDLVEEKRIDPTQSQTTVQKSSSRSGNQRKPVGNVGGNSRRPNPEPQTPNPEPRTPNLEPRKKP